MAQTQAIKVGTKILEAITNSNFCAELISQDRVMEDLNEMRAKVFHQAFAWRQGACQKVIQ